MSLLAVTNEHIKELARRFIAAPFQYYGEKELHFDLHRLLAHTGKEKHLGTEVIREQPTYVCYRCERCGENKGRLSRDDNGTNGHHDLMVQNGSERVAIEMFHGREFTLANKGFAKVDADGEVFFLRAVSMGAKTAKLHIDNDSRKLIDFVDHGARCGQARSSGSIVMFVSAFHRDKRKEGNFLRLKRAPILKHIARLENNMPDGIDIWYIERAYTGSLACENVFIHYPDGRELAGKVAMDSLRST